MRVWKNWLNKHKISKKSQFLTEKNTCLFPMPLPVLTLMKLTDTDITSSVHKFYSVSITPWNSLINILSPLDHMSSVSHHYSHAHKALSLSPFSIRKRSCLDIISWGRGWSTLEQRSKRINHLQSYRLRTATRHTWVVGKLRHLPNDCRLHVYGLDRRRWPAPVNHWGFRILKGI